MRQPRKFGNFPNYELLKYVTKRRDAVAIRAWADLYDLFLSGKDCYIGPPYNRRKRWLRKLKKAGLCYFAEQSQRWRLSQKGYEVIDALDKLHARNNTKSNGF
jgi:hypothetical protein